MNGDRSLCQSTLPGEVKLDVTRNGKDWELSI